MEGPGKLGVELGLLVALLAVGALFAAPGLLLLCVPLTVHLTLGLWLGAGERHPRLVAERTLSGQRVQEGDAVTVELTVENRGGPLQMVFVQEDAILAGHVVEGQAAVGGRLPRGGRLQLRYTALPPRSSVALAGVHVQVRDLLGYVTWEGGLCCPTPLVVLPRFEPLPGILLAPRRTLSTPGSVPSRRGGAGVQFFDVRDYTLGDDVRRLNWKILGRRNRLVVNRYEEERTTDVVLVLDGRRRAYEETAGEPLFDHAVRGCAAIADTLVREGHRTALLMYGERLDWAPAGCGRRHRERLMQSLAGARLGSSEVFAELARLPVRLFPAGSTVILVSPLVAGDEEALGPLAARGYELLALVPDAVSQGLPDGGPVSDEVRLARRVVSLERALVRQAVAAAGVRMAVWDVRGPLAPQVRRAWRRRR